MSTFTTIIDYNIFYIVFCIHLKNTCIKKPLPGTHNSCVVRLVFAGSPGFGFSSIALTVDNTRFGGPAEKGGLRERERERERGFPYKCKLRINKNWGHQSVMT